MGKTFAMGDVHGAHKALIQCLERSGFDYDNDTLIQLGDVADGWSEVYECVEELCNIRNLISIKGNHDQEFLHWMLYGEHRLSWEQGAFATAKSYVRHADRPILLEQKFSGVKTNLTTVDIPALHKDFFENQKLFHVDDKKRLFIHAGFNRHFPLMEQPQHVFYWDRDLWNAALSYQVMNEQTRDKHKFKLHDDFTEIFIGHTATVNWDIDKPMNAAMIWNLDTGAGFSGKLTIMDVDTHEYWQSDNVKELYPEEKGR